MRVPDLRFQAVLEVLDKRSPTVEIKPTKAEQTTEVEWPAHGGISSLLQEEKTQLPAQSGSCGKFSEHHAGGGRGAKNNLCQVLHTGQETEILCNHARRRDVVSHTNSSGIPAATQGQAGMQGQAGLPTTTSKLR